MDLEAFGDGAYRVVRRLAAQSHRQLVSFGNGEEGSAVEARLLGVPWVVWACVCLALAVLFAFLWPAEQGRAVGGAAYLVLRWGHVLVWLLLSAAALLRATGRSLPQLAVLAGLLYAAFLVVLLTSKSSPES